ncbi:MAG TPA: ABC transporter permease [Gemmataceae bacterium]|nr:ABC transporter permease [Gemmataceae bacterium]
MTKLVDRHSADVPLLHVVDGKEVIPGHYNVLQRFVRFLLEPFTGAWRNRDLIAAILRRELRERFSGSVAGWVWAIVAPLISLITYTLVFGGAVKLPNGSPANSPMDYALFVFGGLIAFNFFTEMAYRAPSLLHEYAHYLKQTMFPAHMLPVISTLRAATYATIGLTLMLICQRIFGGTLYWTVLLLPLWFIPFLAFLIGITWLLSAMGAFTRDTAYLMMTLAPVLMFLTPVFWSHETLDPTWRLVWYANILTGFIEVIRDIVVFGDLPNGLVVAWTLFLSAVTFWLGFWFFRRQQDGITDVI